MRTAPRIPTLLLALALAAPALGAATFDRREVAVPPPVAGVASFSAVGKGQFATLDGDWEFHWKRFADPAVLAASRGAAPRLAPYPGEWKDLGDPAIGESGWATYRLRVRGLDPGLDLGIKLAEVLSAARLFADGREVLAYGAPGSDAASEVPAWGSRVVRLGPQADGELDLVLWISNFHDRAGGSRTSVLLGDHAAVAGAREDKRLFELFLVGAFVMMGFYYLCLHAFRPVDRSSLFFGLLCLSLALRTICYDEYFILDLLPGLSWTGLFKLGYLMFSVPVFLFAAFVRSLFPALFDRRVLLGIAAVTGAYTLFFALAPTLLMARALASFQLATLATGLYILFVLARALLRRERGALILAIGFLVFFLAAIRDILIANGALPGPFGVQYGLLAFLFSMSLVITRKFAAAFSTAESLTAELARANTAMKRFVPEEFLALLGKERVEQVRLGDHSAREMTVLFADIARFTALSERLTPPETFAFINRYLEKMGPIIRANGGFVDKYLGDGIMALFPGSPEHAARCAIDMHQALAGLNAELGLAGREPIALGIGIHCGEIMLGTIGENERMDGTVISDAVNLASRIEGVAKDYGVGVAVSERVLLGIARPDTWRIRSLGKIGVRGKKVPVSLYELYDGDPDALRDLKDGILPVFEKALADFYAQDWRAALEGFSGTLAALPGDDASQHYVRMIRKLGLA